MYWSKEEVAGWEKSLQNRYFHRMYEHCKNDRCPRREALRDYRHHRKTRYCYGSESKYVRGLTARQFRRRMKRHIGDEVYDRLVPHDYKTYGWISW